MNISYRWLKAIAPPFQGSPTELAERLGMLGAPVDELTEIGAELEGVVIARVDAVRQHPNADRLRLCTVSAGGAPLQVVCGAPNVEPGGFYPFAPVGTTLPGGTEIRKAKLRGEESEGMLCSARELGLGKDHAGIMALNGEWDPGASFLGSLEIADARLVLDITPNRSDLLSHLGVARELAPGGEADLRLPAIPGGPPTAMEIRESERELPAGVFPITIDDPAECPRFMAAVIEGVRIGPSPEWLATRLRAIGLRSINNVVDATNYVLHELGQPLHAYDLDKLAGPEIRVRRARPGETLRTLDGVDRSLADSALVIADRDRPIGLAGVMGGEESEVGADTTRILLECALFDARRVRTTAKSLSLSTDASHRFERGVDPLLQPRATARAVELILATAGGRLSGALLDLHPRPATPKLLSLRPSRVKTLLGVEMAGEEIVAVLEPIGFKGEGSEGSLQVEVPSYRPDVSREIDVIEEIARRRGYDTFDAEVSHFRPGVVPADPLFRLQASVHELFGRWGFFEARTAAFASADEARVPILNPLSSEESHLRDDLAHGLVRRAEHNWARGVRAIRLYEIGAVFHARSNERPVEETHLAAVFTGPRNPPHWSEPSAAFDTWDLKGLADDLANLLGVTSEPWADASEGAAIVDPAEAVLFRGRDGEIVGLGGRVSAKRIDAPLWAEALWLVEIQLVAQAGSDARTYTPLPDFPAIERDVALVLQPGLTAAQVEQVVRRAGGTLLEEVKPFDLYVGKGIPEGTRSVAWRLRFRHQDRTLTDREVDEVMDVILKALREELNVERR